MSNTYGPKLALGSSFLFFLVTFALFNTTLLDTKNYDTPHFPPLGRQHPIFEVEKRLNNPLPPSSTASVFPSPVSGNHSIIMSQSVQYNFALARAVDEDDSKYKIQSTVSQKNRVLEKFVDDHICVRKIFLLCGHLFCSRNVNWFKPRETNSSLLSSFHTWVLSGQSGHF